MSENQIVKCSQRIDLESFKNQNCYIGVDLAATSDLTAVSFMFVDDEGKLYFKNHYYLPESALIEKSDKELYKN